MRKRRVKTVSLLMLLWLHAVVLWAHPPLPESVLDPRTAPEAWNVLRLATANIEQLLRENRLAEIPDQASLCSPALRALARLAPPSAGTAVAGRTVRAAAAVGSLAQAAMAGDGGTTASAFAALRDDLRGLTGAFEPAAVNAEIYYCPMHPDFVSADKDGHCDRCGMGLQPRRIPYSFVYAAPGEPTVQLTVSAVPAPSMGHPSRVTLRMNLRDGSPVRESDLQVVHTRPIHLLIVDPALEDYQHEHPVPTGTPGEYTFSFTPVKNAAYRVFADLVPFASGVQEYPFVDVPATTANTASTAPTPHGASTTVCETGGLRFVLGDDAPDGSPPRARQARNLRIMVSEMNGEPTGRLEPVMNAFAHLVGFYDDRRTVVHLHPEGGEIVNPAQRGGPSLDFRFYPPKSGFVRMFCQVQIDGKAVYAAFNVNVLP